MCVCVCETKNTSACFFLGYQHFLFLGVHVVLSVFPEARYISKAQRTEKALSKIFIPRGHIFLDVLNYSAFDIISFGALQQLGRLAEL